MDRRKVLGLIGGCASGFAGCLATEMGESDSEPLSSTPPTTPGDRPPVSSGGLENENFNPSDTYKNVDVGSRDGVLEEFRPHDLQIWNAASNQRVVNIRILDRVANNTAHRASYKIPTDTALALSLLTPSRYYVQIWGPEADTETLFVPCNSFDCNSSVTKIGIFKNGDIRSTFRKSIAGCPSPDC